MNVLIDANLPAALVDMFAGKVESCIHTSALPAGNATQDTTILALNEVDTVVTKDTDFYDSFLLKRQPPKLVFVKVGNVRGGELLRLFGDRLPLILELLQQYDCVELHRERLYIID